MKFTEAVLPPRDLRRFICGNFSRKSRSSPSNAQLASAGEIIPPCGVPSAVSWRTCLSIYPDFSHFWRMVRSIGTLAKSQSWEIWSKQDLDVRRQLFLPSTTNKIPHIPAVVEGVGKVGIQRLLLDFQARWESPAFGLFHRVSFSTPFAARGGDF